MATQHVDRVAAAVRAAGVDALVLIPGANLHYTLSVRQRLTERPNVYVLFPDQTIAALLPVIEVPHFRSSWPDAEVISWTDREGYGSGALQLGAIIRDRSRCKPPRLAVEYLNLRIIERDLLMSGVGNPDLMPAEEIMDGLRMIKSPDEIESMRQACRIVEGALERVLDRFEYGITEKKIHNDLKIEMLRLGTEELPVEPIVSSGPRTSHPHGKTSDRSVNKGDVLLIDVGARYNGYCSDLTRTFFVGNPPEEFVRIYNLELQARQRAIDTVRPGVPCGDVDEAAHRVVDEAGYGECFKGRTGHGLGLEAHEQPYMVRGNAKSLKAGMTFTIEPGIFIPELGGTRTEENVVVTDSGAELLTSFPRELRCL